MWNRALASVSCAFYPPHLPKVLRTWHFFTIFMCTFCRPHLPKVLRTRQCFTICMWNRALATVSCAFCQPHLPKVLQTWQFFNIFQVQIVLSLQSGARFVDNFCRSRPATAEAETLLRRPQKPLYPKNTGFRARESFQAWIHAFPTWYTSQLLDDDDVVGMMMWLTYVDMMVRMLPMTIVRNSEVF